MILPRRPLLAAIGLLALANLATTVLPLSFDELVAQAETVVRGTVMSTRCEGRTSEDGSTIVTIVSIRVDETVVGTPAKTLDLEFLGGELNGRVVQVTGQPEFKVGDEDVLFVAGNGRQICPLVGMIYGRFLVAKDATGRPLIARSNGVPMSTIAEASRPMAETHATSILQSVDHGKGMTPDEFCTAIRESAHRQGRTDVSIR